MRFGYILQKQQKKGREQDFNNTIKNVKSRTDSKPKQKRNKW